MRSAFAKNPHMKVFVGCGYYDMATPYFAAEYTFSHMGLSRGRAQNVLFPVLQCRAYVLYRSASHKKPKERHRAIYKISELNVQQMAHFFFWSIDNLRLNPWVRPGTALGAGDGDAVLVQSLDFFRIVRHEPHGASVQSDVESHRSVYPRKSAQAELFIPPQSVLRSRRSWSS